MENGLEMQNRIIPFCREWISCAIIIKSFVYTLYIYIYVLCVCKHFPLILFRFFFHSLWCAFKFQCCRVLSMSASKYIVHIYRNYNINFLFLLKMLDLFEWIIKKCQKKKNGMKIWTMTTWWWFDLIRFNAVAIHMKFYYVKI